MKRKFLTRCIAVCIAAFMAFIPVEASAATLLRRGSRGSEVQMIQTTLKGLGYFTYYRTTKYYGRITDSAVRCFQRDNGLLVDGIVGKNTRAALYENAENALLSGISLMSVMTNLSYQYCGDLDWFTKVRDIWKRGMDAVVIDVDTGKTFQVRRTYGTNHADVEPLTKEDTNIIKEIWGGFSWERRAVVVRIGQYTLAASMTAMPHAGLDWAPASKYVSNRSYGYGSGYNLDAVKNNGASGVMDIHFKNSRTHTTNRMLNSQQNMVNKAARYIENMY